MNTIVTIIELVELAALITLVIYLIRLTRDNNELRDKLNKSELVDRNLDELNEFNGALVSDPDIARIWQDGCDGYRLNDIDRSRFSLLSRQYLSMMSNQKQRADSIEDWAQAEAATGRLIEALMSSPGLIAAWDTLAGKIASPELRAAVNQALTPPEPDEPEPKEIEVKEVVAEAQAPAAVAEESPSAELSEPDPVAAETAEAEAAGETSDSSAPETVAASNEVAEPVVEETPSEDSADDESKSRGEAIAASTGQEASAVDSDETDADVAVAKPA